MGRRRKALRRVFAQTIAAKKAEAKEIAARRLAARQLAMPARKVTTPNNKIVRFVLLTDGTSLNVNGYEDQEDLPSNIARYYREAKGSLLLLEADKRSPSGISLKQQNGAQSPTLVNIDEALCDDDGKPTYLVYLPGPGAPDMKYKGHMYFCPGTFWEKTVPKDSPLRGLLVPGADIKQLPSPLSFLSKMFTVHSGIDADGMMFNMFLAAQMFISLLAKLPSLDYEVEVDLAGYSRGGATTLAVINYLTHIRDELGFTNVRFVNAHVLDPVAGLEHTTVEETAKRPEYDKHGLPNVDCLHVGDIDSINIYYATQEKKSAFRPQLPVGEDVEFKNNRPLLVDDNTELKIHYCHCDHGAIAYQTNPKKEPFAMGSYTLSEVLPQYKGEYESRKFKTEDYKRSFDDDTSWVFRIAKEIFVRKEERSIIHKTSVEKPLETKVYDRSALHDAYHLVLNLPSLDFCSDFYRESLFFALLQYDKEKYANEHRAMQWPGCKSPLSHDQERLLQQLAHEVQWAYKHSRFYYMFRIEATDLKDHQREFLDFVRCCELKSEDAVIAAFKKSGLKHALLNPKIMHNHEESVVDLEKRFVSVRYLLRSKHVSEIEREGYFKRLLINSNKHKGQNLNLLADMYQEALMYTPPFDPELLKKIAKRYVIAMIEDAFWSTKGVLSNKQSFWAVKGLPLRIVKLREAVAGDTSALTMTQLKYICEGEGRKFRAPETQAFYEILIESQSFAEVITKLGEQRHGIIPDFARACEERGKVLVASTSPTPSHSGRYARDPGDYERGPGAYKPLRKG